MSHREAGSSNGSKSDGTGNYLDRQFDHSDRAGSRAEPQDTRAVVVDDELAAQASDLTKSSAGGQTPQGLLVPHHRPGQCFASTTAA